MTKKSWVEVVVPPPKQWSFLGDRGPVPLPFLCEYNGKRKKNVYHSYLPGESGEQYSWQIVLQHIWFNGRGLALHLEHPFIVFASYRTPEPATKILEQSVHNCLCFFTHVSQPFLFLNPQDSSSVIQFVTRAKVRVDTTIWAVEVPNGNSEDATVSLKLVSGLLMSLIWNALEDLALS